MSMRVCATAVALVTLVATVRADMAVLEPDRDNTLFEDPTGMLSGGAADVLFAGKTAGGLTRRALLHFDLSGIPGGTVTSAVLRLQMDKTRAGSTPCTLHRVAADWGEGGSSGGSGGGGGGQATPGSVTWIHRFFDTVPWVTPGGNFVGAASATTNVAGVGAYTWGSTPEMVSDVQAWLDAPGANFGWMVRGQETATQTAKRFVSRETASVVNRPQLTIVYTPLAVEERTWSGIKSIYR